MRKIRPLTLADGFNPRSLRRQVQTANARKQAHMGQLICYFVFTSFLGIKIAPMIFPRVLNLQSFYSVVVDFNMPLIRYISVNPLLTLLDLLPYKSDRIALIRLVNALVY